MRSERRRLPPITLLTILVEFGVIIAFSYFASSQFLDPDPNKKIGGYEGEFLVNSGTFVSYSLERYGYFPLWQSTLATGEPLVENPFSFALNPLSIIPPIIYGSNYGIRVGIVLTIIFAGLGGWALGRVLGFGSLGRVLLALLLAGKGNMIAMIDIGEYQLGGSQAYIAWVIAGTIGILRLKHQRLPVILTPVMTTLMFFAGNIYYVLPTLMSVAALALTHIIGAVREDGQFKLKLDTKVISRLALAGVLTIGFSAVVFLPVFLHQGQIGEHPNEVEGGTVADVTVVFSMFFTDDKTPYQLRLVPGGEEFYQSYVLPFWYALLAFIVFPLLAYSLSKREKTDTWKIVVPALFMIVFCLLWGTGQNPVITWLYANIPFFAQWRYVGRILGVASFWVAVLAVMQVDSLWRTLIGVRTWKRVALFERIPQLQPGLLIVTLALSLLAGIQIISQWKPYGPGTYGVFLEDDCVAWLRKENPNKYLNVWSPGYSDINAYVWNDVRHWNWGGAYFPLGVKPTLFQGNLMRVMPEYGVAWTDGDRYALIENGYQEVTASPFSDPDKHCIWQKPDALPYAFTVPTSTLSTLDQDLPYDLITPVAQVESYPGHVGMAIEPSDEAQVVTVQEVAYPGWTVSIDNQPAKLESIGGLSGVVVPPGEGRRFVHFAYHPPLVYVGAAITVLSALLCIAYLLRLDRFVPNAWIQGSKRLAARGGRATYTLLTSPEIFEPRHLPPDEIPLLTAHTPPTDEDEPAAEETPEDTQSQEAP